MDGPGVAPLPGQLQAALEIGRAFPDGSLFDRILEDLPNERGHGLARGGGLLGERRAQGLIRPDRDCRTHVHKCTTNALKKPGVSESLGSLFVLDAMSPV